MEAFLANLSRGWPRTDFSCRYAFIEYEINHGPFGYESHLITNISEPITRDLGNRKMVLALDWRIGALNCKEAKQNPTNFMCHNNSECKDFDAVVGGYLCSCLRGYQARQSLPLPRVSRFVYLKSMIQIGF